MIKRIRSRVALFLLICHFRAWNLRSTYLSWRASFRTTELDMISEALNSGMPKRGDVIEFAWHRQAIPGYLANLSGQRMNPIAWEAPVCFTMYRNGQIVAGMAIELQGKTLCIRQLQGVPGVRFPKHLIDWPLLMVKIIQKHVEESSTLNTVRIISAENRFWYHGPYDVDEENLPLFQRRLKRRYDGTAQAAGFCEVNKRYWEWPARK